MKTVKTILADMISDVISATSKVTYFGKDGVARGILHAVSNTLGEIWNDLYQTKRQIFTETAEGADLDLIAARSGMSRLASTKSSAIVLFNGPSGTVIPINTIVQSPLSGAQYKTLAEIILGAANPNIQRPILEYSIGDAVISESLDSGSKSQVNANELTQLSTPVTGVTVTNHSASWGGKDNETDIELRDRITNEISILNQGTQLFYETLSQNAEATVYLSKAFYNPVSTGVDIYLVKKSFAIYTQTELDAIASSVYDNQRALSGVKCFNAVITGIEVSFSYKRDTSITQGTVFASVSNKIAELIRENFDFAATIKYQDILNIVIDTPGVQLNVPTLLVNNRSTDVVLAEKHVPRFVSLTINDGVSKSVTIEQKFEKTAV